MCYFKIYYLRICMDAVSILFKLPLRKEKKAYCINMSVCHPFECI